MPPLHEGNLNVLGKLGRVRAIKRWNKRFVVLTPDSIVPFFPEQQLLRPDTANRIYLANVQRILQPKTEADRFEVFFVKRRADSSLKSKQMSFQAANGKVARIWMRKIVSAVRQVHTNLAEKDTSLPARKRFSLPFVVSHFGHAGMGGDEQITKAFSPRRRSLMRQRSMKVRERKDSDSMSHTRTLSQAVSSSGMAGAAQSRTHVESDLFQSVADMALGHLSTEQSIGERALLQLLGDDTAILQTMLTLTDASCVDRVCEHLPGDVGRLLLGVMLDRRYPSILDSVLHGLEDFNTEVAVACIIRLRWWSLLQQLHRHELSRRAVRDQFSFFVSDHLNGDEFTLAAKDAVISCLKGNASPENSKQIQNPEAWKGLLHATLNCPMEVKNEVFKDIAFLVVDNAANAESLCSQHDWLQWLLQPVLFERSGDMDKHMRLRMLFLTLLHFHLFFTSLDFEATLVQTLCQLHLWGLDGRIAANAMLECLVAKLQGATHRFPHDFDRIVWKNLLRLLRVVQVFVFCTSDWDKRQKVPRGRRMSTCRVESRPRSPRYFSTALDDAKDPKTLGQRRFGPHLTESGESDIVENCYSLLKSLGLLEHEFGSANLGRFDSVSAKAIALSARDLALFFRDATVFMLLLNLRESCLSQLQIRLLTRSLLGASSASKRLETVQRLARLPLCEVEAVQMLSGSNRRASAKFANVILQNSPNKSISTVDTQAFVSDLMSKLQVGVRRSQMRVYHNCFFGSELVRFLIDDKVCTDIDSAVLVGTLLHGTSIISCVIEGSCFTNSNVLCRFACHDTDNAQVDLSQCKEFIAGISVAAGTSAPSGPAVELDMQSYLAGSNLAAVKTSTDGSEINFLFGHEQPSDGELNGLCMTMTMSKAMSLAITKKMRNGGATARSRPSILGFGKKAQEPDGRSLYEPSFMSRVRSIYEPSISFSSTSTYK